MSNSAILSRSEIQHLFDNDRQKFDVYFNQVCNLASTFTAYNDDLGKVWPLILRGKQKDIFFEIVTKWHDRVNAITHTRFGKSFVVAAWICTSACLIPNTDWTIVAPSQKKAGIIMDNTLKFIVEHPVFKALIPKTFRDKSEQLKHERSRERITLSNGSSIRILSADADSKIGGGRKLMGFGARNLILDESAEIPNDIFANIMRMLADYKDNFFMQLGNPWFLNHFYNDWCHGSFYNIKADYKHGIECGRLTPKQVEEFRRQAHFDVLFEGNFPEGDVIDKDGWMPLFSKALLDLRRVDQSKVLSSGKKVMGVDVSYSGGDQNVWCVRDNSTLRVISRDNNKNPVEIIGKTMALAKDLWIEAEDIYIDATAGGNIIQKEFEDKGFYVNPVNFKERANNSETYRDRKTEGYYQLYEWLSNGGQLIEDNAWNELNNIKVKQSGTGKAYIISKEELRRLWVHSPDVADAAMLTCIPWVDIQNNNIRERTEEKRKKINRFN